jgi:hypothetical protein
MIGNGKQLKFPIKLLPYYPHIQMWQKHLLLSYVAIINMSKSKSEYNGIMYKLSIKYSLNSHPWVVASWLQSVMLWGNTTRDEEYMCRDSFMDCFRLSFYAYLLFSLVLYSLCQVEQHRYKICTGLSVYTWFHCIQSSI